MPKLTIDNQRVEVPPGTRVIDAAEQAGIMIPRFCYHPALGAVGACRMCAVQVLEGSCRGIRMSCMIEAEEGMVISTTDEEAVAFRRQVIEWLMANHPHDCPVCDEGGQCLLQDMTVSGGHGRRRLPVKKRTHVDQYLGPLVAHEMNRCIQCYRCVRFYREHAGYTDLGVMGSAGRVYFGRRSDGVLESPFAGNLIDVCPTGVFTDRPSRFKGRYWDFERTPSVCIHCSLGCRVTVNTRYREVVRVEAAHDPQVNGWFICDRGRYGFPYASSPQRPRSARIDSRKARVDEALDEAARRLSDIAQRHGSGSVALAASGRVCLETLGALTRFGSEKGWRGPFFRAGPHTAEAVQSASRNLEEKISISLKDIEKSDFILMVGCDPVNEAPMLALAVRQARRRGAVVALADARSVQLPLDARRLALRPSQLTAALMRFAGKAVADDGAALSDRARAFLKACRDSRVDPAVDEQIDDLGLAARESRWPVVVCGTSAVAPDTPAAAANVARLLAAEGRQAGFFPVLPGANALALGLAGRTADHGAALREAFEKGDVRALVVVETDLSELGFSANDPFLENLEALVVCDCLDSAAARAARVFIPTQTVFEAGGTFVNAEARVREARPAFRGGTPTAQVSGGGHPPRTFSPDIPGADPLPAWQVLAALAREGARVSADTLREALPAPLCGAAPGKRLALPASVPDAFQPPEDPATAADGGLEVVVCERIFGSEPLSRHSACLQELESAPRLGLHPGDAAALQLSTGQRVAVNCGRGVIEGEIEIVNEMARGVLLVPRLRGIDWHAAADGPLVVAAADIRSVKPNGES